MKDASIEDNIACIARQSILDGPTRIKRLNQLSDEMGIDLWIKRDDEAGPSFGGNKARQNADTVLITGAVQSNFVRLAAAIAATLNIKAVVQLEERVANTDQYYRESGNVLLNQLLGAEIRYFKEGNSEDADAALYAYADQLQQQGRRPYVIALSGKMPPLGALGYFRCAKEITEQSHQAFDHIIVGTGSGASHLGLTAGMKNYCPTTQVTGSCVRRPKSEQLQRLYRQADQFNELVDHPGYLKEGDFHVWDGAFSPGYGKLSDKAAISLHMMARKEGYILDPVYTAKSFAAIPGLLEEGHIKKGDRVLFIHTGGLGAFFAYQKDLAAFFNISPNYA
jgi:1-aminocyclopropane-1-carboxylate deaminase/D-cysteine desulfhydrase-like pyridoxal-dependent ACC family enzyme